MELSYYWRLCKDCSRELLLILTILHDLTVL